jgi:hypothetical protein
MQMRGFKIVIRHFLHEVADVEPVLSEMKQQNPQDFQVCCTAFIKNEYATNKINK